MKVHQIVHNSGLQVVLDSIDDNLFANVHDLEIREMALFIIDCLIDLLVVLYAVSEVLGSLLGILANIIRTCGFDLKDVAHDYILVIAL